jgi:polyhydroxybutyrate depolymerase
MKNIFGSLFFLLLMISCKKSDTPSTDNSAKELNESQVVDGNSRTYQLYIPSQINAITSIPLVFVLHGGNGNGSGISSITAMKTLAEKEKFIAVFPDGIQKNWNDGRPTNANLLGINDVRFFDEMINKISGSYKIDPKRIYATGISNGGFMSMRLACELSNRFAAVAAVSASIEQGIGTNCAPASKVSVIIMQGVADPLVPFTGGIMTAGDGGTILSHAEAVNKWVSVNNCSTNPLITDLPDLTNDGTTIKKRAYTGGSNGTEVISYIIQNGGHTWPGGSQYLPESIIGKTSMDINATEEIWNFFKAHAKP